jgi:peptidoglycan/xylan/chitin deacetylase (PgdA/CDA1 family)
MSFDASWLFRNPLYNLGKNLMFAGLFRSGLVHIFRRRQRDTVLVLIYHDVLPPGFPQHNPLFGMTVSTTEFEWQLGYLQKHYNPITFHQFANWFSNGEELPPFPVLITFDDGHANNFQFALPILLKFNMTAACFIVSENLGEYSRTWFEDAYYRLMFSPATSWKLRSGETLPLSTEEQRAAACGRFFVLCRSLKASEQAGELKSLHEQLALDSTQKFPERFKFLSAEEIRSLQQSGVEVGAHTTTHPILSTLPDEAARSEIARSKAQLEEESGVAVRAFAYPFGAPGLDFAARERDFARQSGFLFAFAGEGGFVDRTRDPFNLPRIGIGKMTRPQFAATITGTTDALKAWFRRGA